MRHLSTAYLTFRAISSSTFRMGGQSCEIPSVLFPLIDKCALTWADQSLHWRGESSLYNNVFGHHQAGHLCLGQDQACHLSRWPGQVPQPLLVASPAHPASHGIGFDQQVFNMNNPHPWSSFACFLKGGSNQCKKIYRTFICVFLLLVKKDQMAQTDVELMLDLIRRSNDMF